ncbi:MAG: ABC transporter permease [Deltaproteobacteria bacterium]|nr:ABC transporter permease [Deltaproteobacteria bacterium]
MSASPATSGRQAARALTVTDISAERRWWRVDWREIWRHRELVRALAWRDLKVRYRQAALGVLWAVLTPVVTMLVFDVLFGRLAPIDTGDTPYPVFSLAGLLAWRLYQGAVTQAGSSLVRARTLVSRLYCPRLLVPLAATLPPIVDFAVAFVVLVALLGYYRLPVGLSLLALPVVVGVTVLAALGVGLFVAAASARYHDVEHVFGFAMQTLLFLSPIIYPADKVYSFLEAHGLPAWCYGLNPVTGVIESFRWCVLGEPPASFAALLASLATSVTLFAIGLVYFSKHEDTLADYL